MSPSRGLRIGAASVASTLIVGSLAWLWGSSLLPETYSAMEMGHVDHGRDGVLATAGATSSGHASHAVAAAAGTSGGRSVETLSLETLRADVDRPADVAVALTAREETFRLASGREVDGYTLNGQSPGPEIRASVGELIEVRLVNVSVADGITLHWHGVDVPNAEDGVAGLTQDAVAPGQEHVYRFVADRAGTFWYHSHQMSHEQVARGLLGALVVLPAQADDAVDVVALAHLYEGARTINGREGDTQVGVAPGSRARVRVINTDNGPTPVWVTGASARLVAVDGTDLVGATPIGDAAVLGTAGGRADLEVTTPSDGSPVRVQVGAASVVLGSESFDAPSVSRPPSTVDLLTYGTPAPIGVDVEHPDRTFRYDIGRRPGFLDGRPGFYWTINGRLWPDVPMFQVAEGDVVRMTITNRSGDVHPMHLHGHHAVVLSRNGVAATGSPWWVDSLNVADGETYEIAFLADNPGIWMDHCHNLPHAREGLVAHLAYEGVTTPFTIGGAPGNTPE